MHAKLRSVASWAEQILFCGIMNIATAHTTTRALTHCMVEYGKGYTELATGIRKPSMCSYMGLHVYMYAATIRPPLSALLCSQFLRSQRKLHHSIERDVQCQTFSLPREHISSCAEAHAPPPPQIQNPFPKPHNQATSHAVALVPKGIYRLCKINVSQ